MAQRRMAGRLYFSRTLVFPILAKFVSVMALHAWPIDAPSAHVAHQIPVQPAARHSMTIASDMPYPRWMCSNKWPSRHPASSMTARTSETQSTISKGNKQPVGSSQMIPKTIPENCCASVATCRVSRMTHGMFSAHATQKSRKLKSTRWRPWSCANCTRRVNIAISSSSDQRSQLVRRHTTSRSMMTFGMPKEAALTRPCGVSRTGRRPRRVPSSSSKLS
mmetsp:Transcript_16059/g.43669  ORF Transcript_16059/g.43669 Transcript_16059/m.43669 type:complete len:220 (+) Transcript_16059:1020-1679(+)